MTDYKTISVPEELYDELNEKRVKTFGTENASFADLFRELTEGEKE